MASRAKSAPWARRSRAKPRQRSCVSRATLDGLGRGARVLSEVSPAFGDFTGGDGVCRGFDSCGKTPTEAAQARYEKSELLKSARV